MGLTREVAECLMVYDFEDRCEETEIVGLE